MCGLDEPTGIIATDDIDALVNLGADCVVYTSQGETRPMEAIDQMAKFLAAGINVVGTSMVWLVTPRHADDWLRDALGARLCGRQSLALRQRHRPRLLRRYAGALGGQPDHAGLVDHRAGDLRLR